MKIPMIFGRLRPPQAPPPPLYRNLRYDTPIASFILCHKHTFAVWVATPLKVSLSNPRYGCMLCKSDAREYNYFL